VELIDIGVNLTHSSFRQDLHAVIERAIAAGVVQMVVTGTDPRASEDAQDLASRHPGILYSTAGVHPHDAKHWTDATGRLLAELAAAPEVVALGEMGLDFYRDYSPRPEQERAFEAQLELACDLAVPVFLHERDAGRRFFALLERYRDRLPRAILHCFTGGRDELAACQDLDLHVGITGWICDERRGLHLRELIPLVPADRLMLETDAPFILPRNMTPRPKDRRNEPAYLTHVLGAVSETLEQEPEEVASATTGTARTFFGLPAISERADVENAEQT